MQGDPYNRIIKLMQKHGAANNPSSIELGTVININPLLIKVADLQLDKDNLLIASGLCLNIGDLIATTALGDLQTYIILAKVVSIDE